MKNASAIICTDLHIDNKQPVCRTDDFVEAQEEKYAFLKELRSKHNDCPILISGDLFDYWKPSPALLSWTFRNLPDGIIAIPGQHDLPAHNLDNIYKTGIQVLADAGKIVLLAEPYGYNAGDFTVVGFPWRTPLTSFDKVLQHPHVALIHKLVYQSKEPFPGAAAVGGTARSIMKQMKGFDLIVSGDNHQSFSESIGGRVLVNAGSFMRTTANQIDHKPCVYLWDAETNEVERVCLPIEKGVVTRNHIEVIETRDDRIEAFVSRLDSDVEVTLDFEENLRNEAAQEAVPAAVESIILEALEGEK